MMQQIQPVTSSMPQTVSASHEINVIARPAGELALPTLSPAMAGLVGLIVGLLIGWAVSQQMKDGSK